MIMLWIVSTLVITLSQTVHSFTLSPSQRLMSTPRRSSNICCAASTRTRSCSGRSSFYMKDGSCSYWFKVGDKVQVSSSVKKAGIELEGRRGEVTETWEKCDVDPTCCCAEFVDDNFAVTVKFQGKLDPTTSTRTAGDEEEDFIKGIDTFTHYFNEDELLKIEDEDNSSSSSSVAFDGMSCKAFKLDQLKMGQQAQRIAAFEQASRSKEA